MCCPVPSLLPGPLSEPLSSEAARPGLGKRLVAAVSLRIRCCWQTFCGLSRDDAIRISETQIKRKIPQHGRRSGNDRCVLTCVVLWRTAVADSPSFCVLLQPASLIQGCTRNTMGKKGD